MHCAVSVGSTNGHLERGLSTSLWMSLRWSLKDYYKLRKWTDQQHFRPFFLVLFLHSLQDLQLHNLLSLTHLLPNPLNTPIPHLQTKRTKIRLLIMTRTLLGKGVALRTKETMLWTRVNPYILLSSRSIHKVCCICAVFSFLKDSEESLESEQTSQESSVRDTWISWFCSSPGHAYFVPIPEEYIEDDFNLTGLSSIIPYFNQGKLMVLTHL